MGMFWKKGVYLKISVSKIESTNLFNFSIFRHLSLIDSVFFDNMGGPPTFKQNQQKMYTLMKHIPLSFVNSNNNWEGYHVFRY